MNKILDLPMPKPKKAEGPEETVVKIEKELVDMMKIIINAQNSRMPAGKEKLTIAKYLSSRARKLIVEDYNAAIKTFKPAKE